MPFLFFAHCSSGDNRQNHLSRAASPYLQEHADNPVDWYEWGDEVLQTAKRLDKPLLVSIGYSSCHWCHVMEKETFMDTAVARIMNENFVCINVDREERPDIDQVYSGACQLIAGSSGWPLNAFALPDGRPFFAGTYYSKQSWLNLLRQIVLAYRTKRQKVELQARELSNGIATLELPMAEDSISGVGEKQAYQHIFEKLYPKIDGTNGGWKGTPKFPDPAAIEFQCQYFSLTGDKRALDAINTTLTKMALGGIYDQVGGGFARYATDSAWHIPHFEKMLCDNALLLSVYAHAYQITGNDFFKSILQETVGFIQRDLGNRNGGYSCAVNADTRAGEGDFYAWSSIDLQKSLPADHRLLADYYHVSEEGNWKTGKDILFAGQTPAEFARANRMPPEEFVRRLTAGKQTLLAERNKREHPSIDDKVLTSWNALLITGFLDAYAAIGENGYLQVSLKTAQFLEKNMIRADGGLWRMFRNGQGTVSAFLDDYANLSRAFIRLYELTFDRHWLDRSQQLTEYAIKHLYAADAGLFFYTASQPGSVVIQRIDVADNAQPSPNAVMAEVLYRLSVYFEKEDYRNLSTRMLSKVYGQIRKEDTRYYASWASLAGWFSYGTGEVAIMGKGALAKARELEKHYLPLYLFMGSAGKEDLPLLVGKGSDTKTLIYVCTNKVCKRPVEETADALVQINSRPQK